MTKDQERAIRLFRRLRQIYGDAYCPRDNVVLFPRTFTPRVVAENGKRTTEEQTRIETLLERLFAEIESEGG